MYNRSNKRINYLNYLTRQKFQSSESPFFFGYGRTALKIGLQSCNIRTGKQALIPEYICEEALDPFRDLGIDLRYYSVNPDLSPDWDSVKNCLTKDVSAILMVHYFGIPRILNALQILVKNMKSCYWKTTLMDMAD